MSEEFSLESATTVETPTVITLRGADILSANDRPGRGKRSSLASASCRPGDGKRCRSPSTPGEPNDFVPPYEFANVDRAAIEASHHARSDGTIPVSHRAGFDLGLPTDGRIVNGVEVAAGGDVAGWAQRLRYVTDACIHAGRPTELWSRADRLEQATKEVAQ